MKAIKTKFNGIEYRSKLEARWAVFFTHYGMKFEYEKESFKLKNGIVYCPDFYFPEFDSYCEIKPLITEAKNGYKLYKFETNIVGLTALEYKKLINFEFPISLCCGTPIERNFINFHFKNDWDGSLNYPTKENFWRWWSCCDVSDLPKYTDIEASANFARYYDFFNF